MAATSRPARIWYQSFVHPIEQAPYIERLQAYLDKAAGPDVKFEVHGLDPPDRHFHALTEFRCAAQTIRNALEAERAGYADFIAQVRPLIAAGAEVILPAGGIPMLLFSRERPFLIDGALVLNGIAVAVKAAEMTLALQQLTGAVVSRRGTYAKASSACVDEYLRARW